MTSAGINAFPHPHPPSPVRRGGKSFQNLILDLGIETHRVGCRPDLCGQPHNTY